MLATQELFLTLDGNYTTVLGQEWRIEVYGIHEQGGHRWIQLSVAGRPGQLLTVSLEPTDGIRHVLMALGTWIAQGFGPTVIRVAHVA
jgi:hypothetical protein